MKKTVVFLFIIALVMGCATPFKQKRHLSKPMVTIAWEKINQNDIQGALVELRRAVEANPTDPEIYYALSNAYWKSDKPAKALENADKAIQYADNLGLDHPGMRSEAYNLKGSILVSMGGDKKKAIDAFQNAAKDELYATPEFAYYNLASVYLSMKSYPEAQKAAQEALEKNAHYAPAWKALSQACLEQGEEDQAVSALKHAVEEFSGYTEAYWDLALLLIKQGDIPQAVKNLNEVVRLDPRGPLGIQAQTRLKELGR